MKVLIVLSALIAASWALPAASVQSDPDIVNDLKYFVNCIDANSYIRHVTEAAKNDPGVRALFAYFKTDEFKNLVLAFDKQPTYLAILKDLEEHGLPVYEFINDYLEILHIDPIGQLTKMQKGNHGVGTFASLMDTLMSDIDDECTKAVLEERIEADPKFKALVDHLKSDEYKQLVEAFKASEIVKTTLEAFDKVGLDLPKFVELQKKFYHYDW